MTSAEAPQWRVVVDVLDCGVRGDIVWDGEAPDPVFARAAADDHVDRTAPAVSILGMRVEPLNEAARQALREMS